jgi:hypothetical protein
LFKKLLKNIKRKYLLLLFQNYIHINIFTYSSKSIMNIADIFTSIVTNKKLDGKTTIRDHSGNALKQGDKRNSN